MIARHTFWRLYFGLFLAAVFLFLTGCAGGVGKLNIETAVDADGDGVQDTNTLGIKQWSKTETTESALIAESYAKVAKTIQPKPVKCNFNQTAAAMQGLSATGQGELARALAFCVFGQAISSAVAASNGTPTTAIGEWGQAATNAVASVENSDAREADAKNSALIRVGTLGVLGYVGGKAFDNAGGNQTSYTTGNIQQSNSVNGSTLGDAGLAADPNAATAGLNTTAGTANPGLGGAGAGSRSNTINIGPGNATPVLQDRAISSQAQVAVDRVEKPTAQEVTGPNTLNDADTISGNKAGISPF